MPDLPLLPPPGVNAQASPLLAGKAWNKSQLVRFQNGMLQKLGGCSRLSSQRFVGTCRGLGAFSDFDGNTYIGIGTTDRLEVYTGGTVSDITPIRATVDVLTPFSTTAGSPTITVTDGTNVAVGDWVSIPSEVSVGGLALQGIYEVIAVGTGTWQFAAGANATSTVAAGGAVTVFTTTVGSHAVTLALDGIPFISGESFIVGVPTSVGGVTLSGAYVVSLTGGVATIQSADVAASTASVRENGGTVRIAYLLETADEAAEAGSGAFGVGPYGTGPFGVASQTAPVGGFERQWSLPAWGEQLLANPTNGPLYEWAPPVAVGNVASVIANAPAQMVGCFVAMPQRQVMAFGCTDSVTNNQDPLLIRWCDVEDYTDWAASATNQAGSFRLSIGSEIVGGMQGPNQALLWTDIDLWVAQYIGFPLVYGFNRVGLNCGLRCLRGAAILGNRVYWIGIDGFFVYDGQEVLPIPCSVWDFIFQNIDPAYPGSTFMAANAFFNEFFCFFPVVGSNGGDICYVKYNTVDNVWDYGPANALARSAWVTPSVFDQPIGADYGGLLQSHENGTDLDGVPMDAWAQTGFISLDEGTSFVSLHRLLPDFVLSPLATAQITLFFVDYPGDPPRQYGPYPITASTKYVWVRGRGRYVSVKVGSLDHGSFWRLGRLEAQAQKDGRR